MYAFTQFVSKDSIYYKPPAPKRSPASQHAKYVKQYRYESDEDFEKVFINSLIYPFNQEAKGEIGR
jgi:hypothetical protein